MIRGIVLTVALVASPAPVAALDAIDFGIQCTRGPFRACAAVDIWTAASTHGGTSLFVQVANVQGRPGFEALPVYGLAAFSIDGLTYACTPSPLYMWGPGEPGPCFGDHVLTERAEWFRGSEHPLSLNGRSYGLSPDEITARVSLRNAEDIELGYDYESDSGAYMWGCDVPAGAYQQSPHSFSTCESAARIRFDLGPVTHLTLSERTQLGLAFTLVSDESHSIGWSKCWSSSDSGNRCVRVPEPTAVWLIVTGMFGLAASRRRGTS